MQKTITLAGILAIGLAATPVSASDNAEQIRQECESQVRSYGFNDQQEYQLLLDACIQSLEAMKEMQLFQSGNPSDDR